MRAGLRNNLQTGTAAALCGLLLCAHVLAAPAWVLSSSNHFMVGTRSLEYSNQVASFCEKLWASYQNRMKTEIETDEPVIVSVLKTLPGSTYRIVEKSLQKSLKPAVEIKVVYDESTAWYLTEGIVDYLTARMLGTTVKDLYFPYWVRNGIGQLLLADVSDDEYPSVSQMRECSFLQLYSTIMAYKEPAQPAVKAEMQRVTGRVIRYLTGDAKRFERFKAYITALQKEKPASKLKEISMLIDYFSEDFDGMESMLAAINNYGSRIVPSAAYRQRDPFLGFERLESLFYITIYDRSTGSGEAVRFIDNARLDECCKAHMAAAHLHAVFQDLVALRFKAGIAVVELIDMYIKALNAYTSKENPQAFFDLYREAEHMRRIICERTDNE